MLDYTRVDPGAACQAMGLGGAEQIKKAFSRTTEGFNFKLAMAAGVM